MAALSTGLNTHRSFVNAFHASAPINSIPPCTTSVFLQQYPLRCFPRLSVFQPRHVSEKARTSSRRQPTGIVCSIKKLAETEAIPLEENPRRLAEKLPYATGVYAMHDKSGELQFIGISRVVADSVLNHLRDVPQLCGSVKIALVDAPDRTALTDAWKVWMEEHINAIGKVPPGNESGNTTWVKKRQAKPDLRLTPGRHVQLTVTLEQLIDKLIAVFDAPRHQALIDPWKFWMDEHIESAGEVPPGNESWNITWMEKERPVKADLRLKPDRYMPFSLPLEQLVDKLFNENEVLVFIKGSRTDPKCIQSCRVLTILYEQMVDYETIDVFDEVYNRGVRKALKVYSDWPTFPQVFVRGNLIGGADELDKMADKGELYELFKK